MMVKLMQLYVMVTRWLFKEMSLEPGIYELAMFARQDGSNALMLL